MALVAAFVGALLNRLRGGWFHDLTGIRSTQLMRLIWSLPTASLIYLLAGGPWWLPLALLVSIFLSLALIGHGAHMIMDPVTFVTTSKNKTELLTFWWLPRIFGGVPDETWFESRREDINLYNVTGMSFIGLVRNSLSVLPLFWVAPLAASLYAASGVAHGPAYWLGWKLGNSSASGELIVGALSWATLVMVIT